MTPLNDSRFKVLSVLGCKRLCRFSPQVDEGDELGGEAPLVRVAELGGVPLHHLGQLVEHTVPLGVGEATRGQLILTHTNGNTHLSIQDEVETG